ncbi:hypothetical protein CkaCkLH20_06950 [Colletotrichum karsti]|uniref:Uncharacterized protein n=1 Tax=Colletotrichum karsti TaxID=1095194 RepID=A0A9P6I3H6_9PEZI|nr:uncharacterized protein CkaCkLH20_06950 [Colletotrichum karsti]KAF9875569.1 hypothetical protein CkaCkLH20_06950 [Colletotrichum karsti]
MKAKPADLPDLPSTDKPKPAPDVSRPDKSPQFTLPPWYDENDDDKAASKDPRPSKPSIKGSKETGAVGDSSKASSSSKSSKPASASPGDRPLILYAFAESAPARENLQFFVKQGLHDAADFVFILNGETNASSIIPEKKNIQVVNRPNTCFDLGAYGEVLRKDNLYKKYKRFITLNASIRGPFLPHWGSKSCWSDLYLDRITDKVKLVGMTANCWPRFHVQSMIWATDSVGIDLLLNPPKSSSVSDDFGTENDPVGMAGCYDGWNHAVHAEIGATSTFLKQGYQVDLMMSAFHKSKNYIEECDSSTNGDVLWNGKYFGTNVHPYETIFIKANRDIDPTLIGHLTTWQQASGFDSYSACSKSS